MAEFDLTFTLIKYLDRHMVLPLLEHLQEKKFYNAKDLLAAKVELVSKTKMVDFAADEYKALHKTDKAPAALEAQKKEVYKQIKEWKEACEPLLKVLENEDLINDLMDRQQFTLTHLKAEHGVTDEQVPHLYRFAKLKFDCGFYADAAHFLKHFIRFSDDEEMKFKAMWGKLAAEILMVEWEAAMHDLDALKEAIDNRIHVDHLEQLQQRSWLIHWSLFVFFNVEDGRSRMINFLFQEDSHGKINRPAPSTEKMQNALVTTCPHVLRYLTAAVIITKRRKNVLKDLSRVLAQEKESYHDPITEFLRTLYSDFDFKSAQTQLKECEKLLANEFFFQNPVLREQFLKNAQMLVFETYCRIHKCIDMKELGERLVLKGDEKLEPKIVQLIKEANVNAKIDSENNHFVLSSAPVEAYQAVMDRAHSISDRSDRLLQTIEKKYQTARDDARDE